MKGLRDEDPRRLLVRVMAGIALGLIVGGALWRRYGGEVGLR